jgi:hypothetical protein
MPSFEALYMFLGKVIAYGGGAAAVAYLIFQMLGKGWIENKFAQRLEQLRHTQALEIQRVRVEIDSMLSAVVKLQEKEFETLPEAWSKFDDAYRRVSSLVSPMQHYPDLDRLDTIAVEEEALAASKLRESEKSSVRNSRKKNESYIEAIFWHRLAEVRSSVVDFHNYVQRNSVFMERQLKGLFEEASDGLWSAMVDKEVGHSVKDWKMQNDGWKKIREEIEPLRSRIRDGVYARLQGHGARVSAA